MANHVYFHITTEESMKDCFETDNTAREYNGTSISLIELKQVHEQPFMANVEKTLDEDGWLEDSYNWYINNVGAKWCNLEDSDEQYLSGYSAWSPPTEMLGHLAKFCKQDLRMTYEDEFRNFIGVAWGDEDGLTSFEEIDGEDLNEVLLEKLGIREIPDEFDWWEERSELEGQSSQEFMDDEVFKWWENN